jgi:hypothetical protein
MPILANVKRADRCDPSTSRMISSLSDAGYLILGRPHPLSCFFKQTQYERLLRHDLLQVTGLLAQVFDFVSLVLSRLRSGL